jgi:thiamine transport system substrate-binding protein
MAMTRRCIAVRGPRTVAVLAAVALAAACSGGTAGSEPSDDGSAPTPTPVTLTLLTHDSFDVSTEVLDGFTRDTGITVTVLPLGDAGTALNQAILTKAAPLGDLLFGIDSTFLSRALDEELFLPHRSEELGAIDPSTVLDPEHRVTPIDLGHVCINHDRAWFARTGLPVPTDLADLTDPAYRGLMTVQNPATSSPGLAFLLATIARFGEDGAFTWWADLRANDVLVTEGWSDAYYAAFSATGGDRPLVVSYATSPAAEVHFADPAPEEAPTGVMVKSCYPQVEFVGILATTEHPDEARTLVDWMLGRDFQEDLPLRMFVLPVRLDATLPDVFVRHAPRIEDAVALDPDVVGARRDEWIARWTSVVLR